jgi:hypothetical protein
MTAAKQHIFVRGKSQKNPLPGNAATLVDGNEAFSHCCFDRHGHDGQNTGMLFASRMSPPVPLLSNKDVQGGHTGGQLKWMIDYGPWPSGIPESKNIVGDEIWSIVVYLRHLLPAGSLGEPKMYNH